MWKTYRRKNVSMITEWTPDIDMTRVSISQADKENGSPKLGDMIAKNPNDEGDRWLIAEKYFKENFEEVC